MPTIDLQSPPTISSILGVVVVTIAIVQLIKTKLHQLRFVNSVPTWCYSVVVSAALTILANRYLHTLQGNLPSLIWQAMFNSAMASGFAGWMGNPLKSLGQSGAEYHQEKPAAASDN